MFAFRGGKRQRGFVCQAEALPDSDKSGEQEEDRERALRVRGLVAPGGGALGPEQALSFTGTEGAWSQGRGRWAKRVGFCLLQAVRSPGRSWK